MASDVEFRFKAVSLLNDMIEEEVRVAEYYVDSARELLRLNETARANTCDFLANDALEKQELLRWMVTQMEGAHALA